jgi:hypothetical protein
VITSETIAQPLQWGIQGRRSLWAGRVFLISVSIVGSKFTNQISPRLGMGMGFNQVSYLKILPFGIALCKVTLLFFSLGTGYPVIKFGGNVLNVLFLIKKSVEIEIQLY